MCGPGASGSSWDTHHPTSPLSFCSSWAPSRWRHRAEVCRQNRLLVEEQLKVRWDPELLALCSSGRGVPASEHPGGRKRQHAARTRTNSEPQNGTESGRSETAACGGPSSLQVSSAHTSARGCLSAGCFIYYGVIRSTTGGSSIKRVYFHFKCKLTCCGGLTPMTGPRTGTHSADPLRWDLKGEVGWCYSLEVVIRLLFQTRKKTRLGLCSKCFSCGIWRGMKWVCACVSHRRTAQYETSPVVLQEEPWQTKCGNTTQFLYCVSAQFNTLRSDLNEIWRQKYSFLYCVERISP